MKPGMPTLRSAAENASTEPITDAQIVAILRSEGGLRSHALAIFGDAWLSSLAQAGRSNGIDLGTILTAYAAAKRDHAAYNRELEEMLANA